MAQQVINLGNTANDGTGDNVRAAFTKANANFVDLTERTINAVRDFGCLADGSDQTTNLQNFINACVAAKTRGYIPAGQYQHRGLTIPGICDISGCHTDGATICTSLKLIGGSNTHSITIPAELGGRPILRDIQINGVMSANSAGHGIYMPDDGVTSYGLACLLYNVNIINVAQSAIYVGDNRNFGQICGGGANGNGTASPLFYIIGSSDWRIHSFNIGFSTGYGLEIPNGADNVVTSTSFYNNSLAAARLTSTWSSPTKLIGCTFNENEREGVSISGSLTRTMPHQIVGCWFACNSTEAEGDYSHILVNDSDGLICIGNAFRYEGGASTKTKYLIEFTGTCGKVRWLGNSWDTHANTPWTVGVSNNMALLKQVDGGVTADGAVLAA